MPLPTFRYHPDPIKSGSIVASDATCVCCKKALGYIYTGPVYSEEDGLDDALCPGCIADGSAYRKYDATFVDENGMADHIPVAAQKEIAQRTPGYSAWQSERWLACCSDAMAFVEPVGIHEVRRDYPQLEGTLMSQIVYEWERSGGAAKQMLDTLHRDHSPTAYVFKCLHCDTYSAFIDIL
jgi:uncharacterized protein CbrC (UPF0167 family)